MDRLSCFRRHFFLLSCSPDRDLLLTRFTYFFNFLNFLRITFFLLRTHFTTRRVNYVRHIMSSLRQLELTAEQLAISQSRKALKLSRKTPQPKTSPILHPRQWLSTPAADHNANIPSHRVKVLSWNVCPNITHPLFMERTEPLINIASCTMLSS